MPLIAGRPGAYESRAVNPHDQERARLREALGSGAGCLTAAQLASVVDGTADAKFIAHAAACTRCTAELALLRGFLEATPTPAEATDVKWIRERLGNSVPPAKKHMVAFPAWRRSPAAWVLAAAALVLLSVALGLQVGRMRAPAVPRTLEDPQVLRSGRLELIAPAGDVGAASAEFSWQAVPGTAQYEVRLMEVDRTELWRTAVTGTSVVLPDSIRGRLQTGKTFVWQVIAQNAGGKEIATSDRQTFRIIQ